MQTRATLAMILLAGIAFGKSNQEIQAEAAKAQNESRKYPVAMECRLEASTNRSEKDWQTSYGSYSETKSSGKVYAVTIRNQATTTNEYTITWHYIGREAGSKNDEVIETDSKTVSVPPRSSVKEFLQSDTYEGSKAVYRALGETDEDGVKVKGIVVQLIIDEKVVRTYSSAQQWQYRAWIKPFELD